MTARTLCHDYPAGTLALRPAELALVRDQLHHRHAASPPFRDDTVARLVATIDAQQELIRRLTHAVDAQTATIDSLVRGQPLAKEHA